jgi:hypothetical protein
LILAQKAEATSWTWLAGLLSAAAVVNILRAATGGVATVMERALSLLEPTDGALSKQ